MTGTSAAPCLVADVGGTNVRFALLHDGKTAENAASLVCADYPDLAAAVRAYFTEAAPSARPTRAAIAVASPIAGLGVLDRRSSSRTRFDIIERDE